jgi:TM2 domain-containing membrane protein YozV
MIGQIESYNPETQSGVIKSGDSSFSFHADNWTETVPPDVGDEVNFIADDTSAAKIQLQGIHSEKPKAVKYRYLAAFLAIFLGWLGLHRLYLGYYRIALLQLAVSALLIYAGFMVFAPQWGFVDGLLLFSRNLDKDGKGRPLK